MKTTWLIAILISTLLSACGSIPNGARPEKISASALSSGKGIVILSTGAPETCVATSTFLKLIPIEPAKGGRLIPVDGYSVASDFADHHGHLNAVALEPGDYYLYAWIANPYVHPIKVPKADFSIRAGEVLYLGEYFQPVSCVINPTAEFRDQRARDMALMEQKNPEIAKQDVITHILKFTGFAIGGPQ